MKLLFITYVFCFFQRTAEHDLWYRYMPVVIMGMESPPYARLPEKEYVIGFLVIHQTR